MGNGASNGVVFKVLLLDGRVEAYKRPIRAAELMVEYPGQFVCDSSYLKVGHRIQWLLADEQLETSKFYFLLPMDLLFSTLTHEEMCDFCILTTKQQGQTKHAKFNHLRKIFPVFGDFCIFPSSESIKRLEGDDHDEVMIIKKEHDQPAVERYYSKQRSWTPTLETIDETP